MIIASKNSMKLLALAFCLLSSGAIGNLIDRFLYGFVVDFIHVLFFPYIFNFADCCVTVGGVDARADVTLSSDFFSLAPGNCTLAFSGCSTHVAAFHERWL